MNDVTIVDADRVRWVSGAKVYDTMEPAFRDNLGDDPELVRGLLATYHMKSLWLDPNSTRRIDHVRTDAGYADLSEAYHHSVEEAYFLGGQADLTAEGVRLRGDYFWRPPGWVHSASSEICFDCLLMMEGEVDSESSGRVSRVVRPDHEAGSQALADADPIGPRGYVRRSETRFMPWRAEDGVASGLSGGARSKVLSLNAQTGSSTRLLDLPAGWSSPITAAEWDRFLINIAGSWTVGGQQLAACSLVHVPAGQPGHVVQAPADAQVLVKAGER